jgi:prepilin-type N-terminal cleavage/methylation domain-containing protein
MKRRSQKDRGYTAIEVLMAMSVFAIGAAGIIGMQRASIQGNFDARRLDLANSLAREWVERLRRDAMLWTTAAPAISGPATDITATKYINLYRDTGGWALPVGPAPPDGCPSTTSGANADGFCPAFDPFGRDLAADHFADAAFCVNVRIDTAATDPAGNRTAVRAMVRVYWPRGLVAAPFSSGTDRFCSAAALGAATVGGPDSATALQIYHFVQTVTLITYNPIPQ